LSSGGVSCGGMGTVLGIVQCAGKPLNRCLVVWRGYGVDRIRIGQDGRTRGACSGPLRSSGTIDASFLRSGVSVIWSVGLPCL